MAKYSPHMHKILGSIPSIVEMEHDKAYLKSQYMEGEGR